MFLDTKGEPPILNGRKIYYNHYTACDRNSLTYGRRYPARPGGPSLEYGRFISLPNTVETTWDLSVRLELVEVKMKNLINIYKT